MKNMIAENILQHNIHKIHGQSEENIQKIAVLFTDIVGSTQYFKTHGDQAGRSMLGRHHNIASEIIHKFQGSVIKNIGDSVMAYFMNPKDALKSAVQIQQKYSEFNKLRNTPEQIHIRISIHFGYGIIEENDIYGDVVNVTAKITPLAEGDQIYISQEVYNASCDLQLLQFESIDVSKRKNVPDGLIIYRVIWDETVIFEPVTTTILIVKPALELAGNCFKDAWHDLFDKKNILWQEKIKMGVILPDMTVVATLKDGISIMDEACNIISHLHRKSQEEMGTSFLPLYIVIDSGNYLRADNLDIQNINVPWEGMDAGDIYLSFNAYESLKKICGSLPNLMKYANNFGSFFKLNIMNSGEEKEKSHLFLHHNALIHGENLPCYYCGSKKHPTCKCPSKDLPEITNAISEMGYKSIDEVNRMYFDYLMKSTVEYSETSVDSNLMIAHQAFYDLKRIFQLRLFRMIWNTGSKMWNDVKDRMCEGSRSGITWIAQDCIRVSDLRKAESLLEDAMIGNPNDYKVYCALGFVNIELRKYSLAEQFLDKALTCAKTDVEKIFLHFLLFRIYELTNNFGKASSKINEIITIDPYCSEAIYLDIVLQFSQGATTEPLRRLLNLIQSNRDYYVYALIDPGLKPFMGIIKPELESLLNDVRDDAKNVLREAEEELKKITSIFCHDESTITKANDTWLKINKLADSDSYYGWLDIIYHGSLIVKTAQRTIGEYKKEISEDLSNLKRKIKVFFKFAVNYHDKKMMEPFYERLETLQKTINESWHNLEIGTPDDLIKVYKNNKSISNDLQLIEEKIKRLATIKWLKNFSSNLLKRSVIYIAITICSALIVMPIVVYYANLILAKLSIPQIYHMWFYQKAVMIIGCILSIVLSFLITCMDLPKKDFLVI